MAAQLNLQYLADEISKASHKLQDSYKMMDILKNTNNLRREIERNDYWGGYYLHLRDKMIQEVMAYYGYSFDKGRFYEVQT